LRISIAGGGTDLPSYYRRFGGDLIAAAIRAQGVDVDAQFFPADYSPPLPHEFQFNLDTDAGREALERLTAFLGRLTG